MPHLYFLLLLCGLLAAPRLAAEPESEESRRDWVGRAISAGGALMDNARSSDPRDVVIAQWMANAKEQAERVEEFDKQMKELNGKPVPKDLMGEMMLLRAYTTPLVGGEKVQDIVFKKQGDNLVCHLIFNTPEGFVDVAYCYNKDGVLTICRIDSLPKGIFLSLPADASQTTNMFILWFSKADVTLVLDKTNPFKSFSQQIN